MLDVSHFFKSSDNKMHVSIVWIFTVFLGGWGPLSLALGKILLEI